MRKKLLSAIMTFAMVLSLMPVGVFAAETSFTDMPSDYSTTALQAAVTNGLLKGTDGKILPNDTVTRAQLAAIGDRCARFRRDDGRCAQLLHGC